MKRDTANLLYLSMIHLITFSLAMMGCATQSKSVGLGGAIGTGTGAALGGIADPGKKGEYRTRNVIVGSALGGMAGMITGSIIHEEMESQKKEAFLKDRASAPQGAAGAVPALKSPRVESRWVEGRVIGNRYIDGHFEYIITEPARWSP